jgi:inner membrane protein involved in colicin E2 resistance
VSGGARSRGVRRPRDPRIRALLVILVILAVGGVVYALVGLAQQLLLPIVEGASLFVVALLCAFFAARRTRP